MRLAFYGMLGLSVIVDLVLGAWASAGWESFASFWFTGDVDAMLDPGTRLIGFVLALALFFFAILQILALRWVRGANEEAGYQVVTAFSAYLLVSGVATFLIFRDGPTRLGGMEFLLLDGARGAMLGILAVLAKREPSTVTELRIPKSHSSESKDRSSNRSDRPQGRRSDESSHRRSRARRGPGGSRGGTRGNSRSSHNRQDGPSGSRSDEKPLSVVVKDDPTGNTGSRRRRSGGRGRQAS